MRKLVTIALAASFFVVLPPVPEAADARSLFETLFPKTAERRRLRKQRELERARRLRNEQRRSQVVKVKPPKPKYYTYKPRAMKSVKLSALQKSFVKAEQQAIVADLKLSQSRLLEKLNQKRLSLDSIASQYSPTGPVLRLAQSAGTLKSIDLMARTGIGKALVSHYRGEPVFLWLNSDGEINEQAKDVLNLLQNAEPFGLSSADYTMESQAPLFSDQDRAKFEFELTARALRYLSDAKHGLVDANRISAYHDFSRNRINAKNLMAALAAAPDPAKLLLDAHPKEPAFAALKAELAALSTEVAEEKPVRIARGTFLKPGAVNEELPNVVEAIRRIASEDLKAKHGYLLDGTFSGHTYSEDIVSLVRDAQKQLKLKPDGIVGKNTIRRLVPNVETAEDKRLKIVLAMERLRWHPDRFGDRHVFINQPAYRVALMNRGREAISMNVVVGKKKNQTNFFHDEIEYVEFNPYWGVPRSILVNEMLPKLRRNASYLDNLGYEVTTESGRAISSSSVNWYGVGSNFPFNVRQPPGPKNALGTLKIMFPNKHAIYMHDTPAKSLFSRSTRAFSHGCVRLERPHEMAAAVLGISVEDVRTNISIGENRQQRLPRKLPVYISYFTAWPTPLGQVKYYSDIYNRDSFLNKAINAEQELRRKYRDV